MLSYCLAANLTCKAAAHVLTQCRHVLHPLRHWSRLLHLPTLLQHLPCSRAPVHIMQHWCDFDRPHVPQHSELLQKIKHAAITLSQNKNGLAAYQSRRQICNIIVGCHSLDKQLHPGEGRVRPLFMHQLRMIHDSRRTFSYRCLCKNIP